jgi:hypothetical protein
MASREIGILKFWIKQETEDSKLFSVASPSYRLRLVVFNFPCLLYNPNFGIPIALLATAFTLVPSLDYPSTLNMGAKLSFEMSIKF